MIEKLFNSKFNKDFNIESGYVLISEPFLPDPNFERSVVLICEHNSQSGSFGLILNRGTDVNVGDLIDLEAINNPLFIGGPVEQNTLHFIHKFHALDGAIHLGNEVYWGGNFEQLRVYAESGMVHNDNSRFFMGYSGWGKKQMEKEVEQNSWIICQIDLNMIFETPPEALWREILKSMGGKYRVFSNFPDDPRLN
jgi:putative transcriptional regulator